MKSIIFLVALMFSARAADLPTIAVVPESADPGVVEFSDLLAVALSKASDQYRLVERAELSRLASEAEVQKHNVSQRPAALAAMTKAHGLVIVGPTKNERGADSVFIRLSAVGSGLVLRSIVVGGKTGEIPKAAEMAAGVLRFPCERLVENGEHQTIVISLMGIRPAFDVDRSVESTVNLAISQSLSLQSGFAVSERWRMKELVFERSLSPERQRAFATGMVLVDGSYTRKEGQFEAAIRLGRERLGSAETFVVRSPAGDAGILGRRIADEIASKLQGRPPASIDSTAEATAYARLGRYLIERGQFTEAAMACESAVALGCGTVDVLTDRVAAYGGQLSPVRGIFSYPPDRNDARALRECPEAGFKDALTCALRMVQYVNDMNEANWTGAKGTKYAGNLRDAMMRGALSIAQITLESVYKRNAIQTCETDAKLIRIECRRLLECIRKYRPGFAGSDIRVGVIYDTPAETIAAYRSLYDPVHLSFIPDSYGTLTRGFGWHYSQEFPASRPIPVIDWSGSNPNGAVRAWREWLDELAASKSMINRVDALALRYQYAADANEKSAVLAEYVVFLQQHFDWFLSKEGQLSIKAFGNQWSNPNNPLPSCWKSYLDVFATFLEQVPWMEPDVYFAISSILQDLPRRPAPWSGYDQSRANVFTKALAARYHAALESCLRRLSSHRNWSHANKDQYTHRFKLLMDRITATYPDIMASGDANPAAGADDVPIRAWQPEGKLVAGLQGVDAWIDAGNMTYDGRNLLLPLGGPQMISLDPDSFAASSFPIPDIRKLSRSIGVADGAMMIQSGRKIFIGSYVSAPGKWTEVSDLGLPDEVVIDFRICSSGGRFYIGAFLRSNESTNQTLVGVYANGKFDWIIAGNRKPEKHPLDSAPPQSFLGVFPGQGGRPLLNLKNRLTQSYAYDLATGTLVCPLGVGIYSVIDRGGELPLGYAHYDGEIIHAYLFDPAKPKPMLLFRNDKTRQGLCGVDESWNAQTPIFDHKRPEFLGETISMIWRAGKLWLLKWDNENAAPSDKRNPNRLRLVCSDPATKQSVVVPLRYDVEERIRSFKGEGCDLSKPTIDQASLISTPSRLLFTAGSNRLLFSAGGYRLSPVLFHVAWPDVENWIAKRHPEFGKRGG